MYLSQRMKFKWNYPALAFAIPCVALLFIMLCSQYEPFGNYSMLYSDMYHQYYPFFVAFRAALRSGESLLYNWDVGMGMDYLGLISYYLASPLNLFSVLVPESWLLEYFSLLVPVKLGIAGLCFSLFLSKTFRKDDLSISIFGAFYGLCAWALAFQWNIMWLDTFALLPLVVLGMVSLLKERKFVLYTLTLFLSVFSNYYIGFFTCIFVFLLFFAYEFCRWQGWKRFFSDLIWIAAFSVLAIGMTAILELPAFAALQTTQSSVNKFPTGFRLNMTTEHNWKGLLKTMAQVAGNMGGGIKPSFKEGLPNLYCGVGSLLLAILYLMAGEVKLRDKVCALLLLVFFNISFIIRQLDYIWHGFHFTNMIPYRFSFLHSFVVLYMAYRAWLLRRKFQSYHIIAAGVLAASLLAMSQEVKNTEVWNLFGLSMNVPVYIIYNVCFLIAMTGTLLYAQGKRPLPEDATPRQIRRARIWRDRRRTNARILAFVFMGVELVATTVAFGLYFTGTIVTNYPKGTDSAASMIRYMHEREKNTLFYRAETTHSQTLNDGALNGYHGVSAFTSSANVKTTEFMKALGYGAKNTYNRYCYEESSPVADLFLGLKYRIERDGKDRSSDYYDEIHHYGNVYLLKNRAYLPLGFLAEPELAEIDFPSSNGSFGFQNNLFAAATGINSQVWQSIPGENLMIQGNDVNITSQTPDGYCAYQDTKSGSNVVYSYVADKDGYLCLHLDLPKRNDYYVSINSIEQYKENISLPQMIAVGQVTAGDVIDVRIMCKADEKSTMRVEAAILNAQRFWSGYDILSASKLNLTRFENTYIEGTVFCDRDGLLYTSIPQNGNWSVFVDGKTADITLVGDCMIGVALTEGEHRLTFTYNNAAFRWGWKISLACTAVFVAMIQIYYKPDWKRLLKQ